MISIIFLVFLLKLKKSMPSIFPLHGTSRKILISVYTHCVKQIYLLKAIICINLFLLHYPYPYLKLYLLFLVIQTEKSTVLGSDCWCLHPHTLCGMFMKLTVFLLFRDFSSNMDLCIFTMWQMKYEERVLGLILVSPICKAPSWAEWFYNKVHIYTY